MTFIGAWHLPMIHDINTGLLHNFNLHDVVFRCFAMVFGILLWYLIQNHSVSLLTVTLSLGMLLHHTMLLRIAWDNNNNMF